MSVSRAASLRVLVLAAALVSACVIGISLMGRVEKSFAVRTMNVGVYWDATCTAPVTYIDWGELNPGTTKDAVVFVRNEGTNESCYLAVWTSSWTPLTAPNYISLSWNYSGESIAPSEAVQTTLTLSVTSNIRTATDFSFDLNIAGSDRILGDLNGDGVVDIYDVVELASAYGTTPGDPHWNTEADLNWDGLINIYDVIILSRNYGLSE